MLKCVGGTLLFILTWMVVYMVAAWLIPKFTIEKKADKRENVAVYILTNGVHTDIVMPIRNEVYDWSRRIPFENTLARDTSHRFIAMGWGDKGFYLETPTWNDLSFKVAFNAAFGLSSAAIHATYYHEMNENDDCKKMTMSNEQYLLLVTYVEDSFKKDDKNHPVWISTNANYDENDAFYEANGRYSLFFTCNTWANTALKKCGQKACWWTPFDTGIFEKYETSN